MFRKLFLLAILPVLFTGAPIRTTAQSSQSLLSGVLTYFYGGSIYTFQLPTDSPYQLIEAEHFARNADGEIAYSGYQSGGLGDHIMLLEKDGLTETEVESHVRCCISDLELSDDGQLIAYHSSDRDAGMPILRRSGSSVIKLPYEVIPMQWIALDNSSGDYLIALDKSNPRWILRIIPPDYSTFISFEIPRGSLGSARFSPDMNHVAYEVDGQIWAADVVRGQLSNLKRLSNTLSNSPSWSPDGQWILYLADERHLCTSCLHVVALGDDEPFILVDKAGEPIEADSETHVFWTEN